jgi:hypothetical protein
MTILRRTIPTRTITKKPMIMKKPTIAIHSQHRDLDASDRPAARDGRIATYTGGFAADFLQMQPSATIDSISDCRQARSSVSLAILPIPRFRCLRGAEEDANTRKGLA